MSVLSEHQKAIDRADEALCEIIKTALTEKVANLARLARGELFSVAVWLRSEHVEEAFYDDYDECDWVAETPCPVCFPESVI